MAGTQYLGASAVQSLGPLQEGRHGSGVSITEEEFRRLRDLVYEKFGINLTEEKKALVIGRLGKLIRTRGFGSFEAYIEHLQADGSGRELDELANRISTNYTFFYRESDHFEFFRDKVLPEMTERIRKEEKKDLRVWCAGCSTGEEPYTLAMIMVEYFGWEYVQWEAGLLATDISARALQKAVSGIYPEEALERLPAGWRSRYFKRTASGEQKVKGEIKKEVTFRRFNLMNEKFPFRKSFHVIFCRNVMIYFDQPTRNALVRRFYRSMVPGGYLFIGHSETLGRDQLGFDYVRPAIYRRKEHREEVMECLGRFG
ncbi:MAG: protein-glutamate O-methyltransferase CheR [Deltaproteobacteria bacterium]|nr:protein-glutamate O-methyltransferase CheR [Deltaproteobacteria bacterium]